MPRVLATFSAAAVLLSTSMQQASAAAAAATAASDAMEDNDVLFSRVEALIEARLGAQREHYEQLLDDQAQAAMEQMQEQQEKFEHRLLELAESVQALDAAAAPTVPAPIRRGRRRGLASSSSSNNKTYSGLDIRRANAGIRLGPDSEVQIVRSGDGELTFVADDVNVTGDLWLPVPDAGDDSGATGVWFHVGDFAADAEERLTAIESSQNLPIAAMDFGAGWSKSYATANTPFGQGSDVSRIGLPYNALVGGVFTAPSDGVYVFFSKIRVTDDSTSSVEVDWHTNGINEEGFDMWTSTGDSSGRRACMSGMVALLNYGDEVFPQSDLATNDKVMGQTDVFKIPSDRVAFNVVASGSNSSALLPLVSLYSEVYNWVYPPDAGIYADGVFTAPHDGLYYFMCKMKVKDATTGDMNIEWQKNGEETEGGFEMWLHTGDFSKRRSHMSGSLMLLQEGDEVWAHSEQGTSAVARVVMSGVELTPGKPAFKVYNNGTFPYTTAARAFGKDATSVVEFDLYSNSTQGTGYSAGVYVAPEPGVYFFETKLRTGDNDNDNIEIEWFTGSGVDASYNNFELWLHQGDDDNRRSGMSTTLLRLNKGDKVYAASDLDFSGATDVIAQWTFSGCKVS